MTGTPFFSMGKFHGFPVDSHGKNLHEVHWIQHLPGFLLDIGPVTGRDKNGSHLGDWLWRNHWQFFGEFTIVYPLATNIAIENGHRNSGFSHWTWWFSIAMLNYQRVYIYYYWGITISWECDWNIMGIFWEICWKLWHHQVSHAWYRVLMQIYFEPIMVLLTWHQVIFNFS